MMRLRDLVDRLSQDDVQLVHQTMNALDRQCPSSEPRPDPSFIWWKAQYLRRLDAEHEAAAPVDVGDRVHAAIAIVAAIAVAVTFSVRFPSLAWAAMAALIAVGAFVIVLVSDGMSRGGSRRAPRASHDPEHR